VLPVDVIGITTVQPLMPLIYTLIDQIRAFHPQCFICLGGYGATFSYEKILTEKNAVDCIVLGEGEFIFLELIRKLAAAEDWHGLDGIAYYDAAHNKVTANARKTLIEDINTLPFPQRAKHNPYKKANIIASRGCHGHCLYCSIIQFYKQFPGLQVRIRKPENVVAEMEQLYHEQDIRYFDFLDDNFLSCYREDKEWITQFSTLIIQKKLPVHFGIQSRADDIDEETFTLLQKAGLKYVGIGIESDSPRMIKALALGTSREIHRKAINTLYKLNIEPFVEFILFEPATTIEDLKYNLEFIREIRFTHLVRQMPITWTNRLVLFKELPVTNLYGKKLELVENDYSTTYKFINPLIDFLAEKIMEWKKLTRELVNHHMMYYHYIAARKGLFGLSKKAINLSRRYLEADLGFLEQMVVCLDTRGVIDREEADRIMNTCYEKAMPLLQEYAALKTMIES